MADYKEIKGDYIKQFTSDPVASRVAGGSWASGGNMNNGRYDGASSGTQTANLSFGGYTTAIVTNTESYNGTSWSNGTAIPTATYANAGTGTQTAALMAGGQTPGSPATTASFEWDGSSWTSGGAMNGGHRYRRGGGTQTAGMMAGGNGGSPSPTGYTETYNGTAFTEVGDMNTARTGGMMLGGSGPNSAGLYFGGQGSNPAESITESWDGSSWTETGDLNTARAYGGGGGLQTNAISMSGSNVPGPAHYTNTENFDGTTWSEVADVSSARYAVFDGGTADAGLIAAGQPGGVTTTEEFTAPAVFTLQKEGEVFFNTTDGTIKATKKVFNVPAAVWATGGNLNTGRTWVEDGMAGTQTATILMGGYEQPSVGATNKTELYNGSSWTTSPATLNTARGEAAGVGTQTAALLAGGRVSSAPYQASTETFDGTSFTEVNDMVGGEFRMGSAGNQTAALAIGGGPPYKATTESWDGSNWTEVNDLNTAKVNSSTGSQTAALCIGGELDSAPTSYQTAQVESWDGTSWTEIADLNATVRFNATAGTQTEALSFGGYPTVANNEYWNGTSWTEVNNLSNGRYELGGAGTSTAAIAAAGNPNYQATEEFTVPSPVQIKTVTVS